MRLRKLVQFNKREIGVFMGVLGGFVCSSPPFDLTHWWFWISRGLAFFYIFVGFLFVNWEAGK